MSPDKGEALFGIQLRAPNGLRIHRSFRGEKMCKVFQNCSIRKEQM